MRTVRLTLATLATLVLVGCAHPFVHRCSVQRVPFVWTDGTVTWLTVRSCASGPVASAPAPGDRR